MVVPQLSRSADLQRSLTVSTSAFAVLGIALYVFLFRNSHEVARETADTASLGTSLRALGRNTPLVLLCVSALAVLSGLFAMQTLQIILTGLGPAVLVGLGALIMLAYPLTERRYRRIVDELTERNRQAALGREEAARSMSVQ